MLSRLVQLLPPRVRRFLRRIPVLVRLYQWLQRGQLQDRNALVALVTVTVVIGISAPASQTWFSPSAVVLTVPAGGLTLRVRSLGVLLGAVGAALLYDAIAMGFSRVGPGVIATIIVTAVLATVLARSREQLGVKGLRGEQMLLELRDRLGRRFVVRR
jgi:hypothetical protein